MKRIPSLLFLPMLLLFFAPAEIVAAQGELDLTLSADSQNIYTTESTGILATLTTPDGEPVEGKEITFATNLGTVNPEKAVTDANGEARVIFTAPKESGTSQITASANGVSQTIEVTVISTGQWIVNLILCLLGMFGVGGSAAALYWRRVRKTKKEDEKNDRIEDSGSLP